MKHQKFFLVTVPRYSIFVVIIFLVLSMMFYQGGTMNDPTAIGYSFTHNFFSDLGIFSLNNIISVLLFAIALTVCGLTFNAYFYYFIKLFPEKNINGIIARLGSVAGMFGGFCFMAVGFTPSNYILDPHIFFANWAFRSFLITSILLSIALYRDNRFSRYYVGGYTIFAILILVYVLILEFAPNPGISDFSLMFNVVSQKIIVLVFIFSVLLQSFGNSKLIAEKTR